jgi:hypothetical protein
MGIVTRKSSGFIYEDDFTLNGLDDRWEVSPNDLSRITLSNSKLTLLHGDTPVYVFFNPLSSIKNFVLDVKNNYNPTILEDLGGLIVFGDENYFINVEEYYDAVKGITNAYQWLRLIRQDRLYTAYWSNDGVEWNIIGSQSLELEQPKIGIYLLGEEGQPLEVEYVRVFTSTRIVVENLQGGAVVDLIKNDNTVIDSKTCRSNSSRVIFDSYDYDYPINGKFSITNGNNTIMPIEFFDIWRGDIYKYELSVDLYYEKEESNFIKLNEDIEQFLGHINTSGADYKDVRFMAKPSLVSGTVKMRGRTAQHITNQYINLVKLSLDDNGTPVNFTNEIPLTDVPNTGLIFWVRLFRNTFIVTRLDSEVYFGLEIESIFN